MNRKSVVLLGCLAVGLGGVAGVALAYPPSCWRVQKTLTGSEDPPCGVGTITECELQNIVDECGREINGTHMSECVAYSASWGQVAWVICGNPPAVDGPWIQIGDPDPDGRCCYVTAAVYLGGIPSTDGVYINNCDGADCAALDPENCQ